MSLYARGEAIGDYIYLIKHMSFMPFILFVILYKKHPMYWAYIMLFAIYFILSMYFIKFDYENLYGRLLYPFFLFLGLLYLKVDNKELILKVILIVSILTIYTLLLIHIIVGENLTYFTNRDRVSLGFGLAHFPILAAVLVMLTDYIKLHKYIKIIINVPILILVVLSYSRTAILITIIYNLLKSKRKKYYIIIFFILSLGMFGFSYEYIDNLSTGRFTLWSNIIYDNFSTNTLLLGVGEKIHHIWEHSNRANIHMVHFDNSYFETFLKMGLFGMFAMLGVFYVLREVIKKRIETYRYGLSITIILIIAMFNSILFTTGNLVFVILVLMALTPIKENGKYYRCL